MDWGDDDTVRGLLVPLVYISAFFLTPLFLLFKRFEVSNLFDVFAENSGLISFTFNQALLSALLVILIGVPLSRILARRELPKGFGVFVKVVSKVPFVVPGVSMALGFLLLLGRKGLLNTLLAPFGFRIDVLYSFPAVLMGHVFYNVPVVIYVLGSVWESFDGDLIESAKMDGASDTEIFFLIELPNLLPALISSFLMAFTYCFTSFAVVLILGGVRYSTLEVAIYTYMRVLLDFKTALALSLIQLVTLGGIFVIRSLLPLGNVPTGRVVKEKIRPYEVVFLAFVFFFVLSPLFLSLIGGFMEKGGWKISAWNFETLGRVWDRVLKKSPMEISLDTFKIAFVSAFLSVSIATLSGRYASRGFRILSILPLLPSAVSTVTLAFGYVVFFTYLPLPEVLQISLLHSFLSLPMVHSILEASWRGIDRSLEEAAALDGVGAFKTFLHIDLPLMWRSFLRSFTLSMAISMSDLSGVLMLSRKTFTLSSAVYRLSSSRNFPASLALNTVLVLSTVLIFTLGEVYHQDS